MPVDYHQPTSNDPAVPTPRVSIEAYRQTISGCMTNLNHRITPTIRGVNKHIISRQAHNSLDTLGMRLNRNLVVDQITNLDSPSMPVQFGDQNPFVADFKGGKHGGTFGRSDAIAIFPKQVSEAEVFHRAQEETEGVA